MDVTSLKLMPPRAAAPRDGGEDALFDRVRRRLLPFLFLLYLVAYLDRINIGFAAVDLRRDLMLSSEQFGVLSGIFFWGYCLFEVPSNLLLHRFGARRWIARILISWGLVAALTGFARNATELYVARFLLGLAEAGFFPGIIFYLSLWFRERDQARAVALFMLAIPIASVVGGPLSGWILDHVHGLGLSGWRWLLVIEALPAVVLGALTYRLLPSGPSEARFLRSSEQAALREALARDAAGKRGQAGRDTGLAVLLQPAILRRLSVHALFNSGLYALGFWMPQSIQALARGSSHTMVGFLILIPNALSLVSMLWVSRHSDRCGERRLHAGLSLLAAALGLCFVGEAHSLSACVALWCIVAAGISGYFGPFWAGTNELFAGRAAAAGFAWINSFGALGAYAASMVLGSLTERTGQLTSGLRWVAVALTLAAALLIVRKWRFASDVLPFARTRCLRESRT